MLAHQYHQMSKSADKSQEQPDHRGPRRRGPMGVVVQDDTNAHREHHFQAHMSQGKVIAQLFWIRLTFGHSALLPQATAARLGRLRKGYRPFSDSYAGVLSDL